MEKWIWRTREVGEGSWDDWRRETGWDVMYERRIKKFFCFPIL